MHTSALLFGPSAKLPVFWEEDDAEFEPELEEEGWDPHPAVDELDETDVLGLASTSTVGYSSTMSTPLDSDLKSYLDEGRRQRSTDGEKLDRVADAVNRLTNEHLLMRQSIESEFKLVHHQIAGINARVDKVEYKLDKTEDNTGITNVEGLRSKLKDEREKVEQEREKTHFVYKTIIAGLGGLMVLLLSGSGTVVWYLITNKH